MLIQTKLKRFILSLHVGGYGDETVIIGKFSVSHSKFIPKNSHSGSFRAVSFDLNEPLLEYPFPKYDICRICQHHQRAVRKDAKWMKNSEDSRALTRGKMTAKD